MQWSSPARPENGARAEEAPRRRLEGAPRAVRPACLVVAVAAVGAGPAPRQLLAQQETQSSLSLSLSSIHPWEVRGLFSQSKEGLCTPSSGEQATLCKEKARSMPHRPSRPARQALSVGAHHASREPQWEASPHPAHYSFVTSLKPPFAAFLKPLLDQLGGLLYSSQRASLCE